MLKVPIHSKSALVPGSEPSLFYSKFLSCERLYLSWAAFALLPCMTYATALKRQLLSSSTLRRTMQLPSGKLTEPAPAVEGACDPLVLAAGGLDDVCRTVST